MTSTKRWLTLGLALTALSGCEKLKGDLPSYKFDDASLASVFDTGSRLGEVRTESDPAPTAPGVWLLGERKVTWVLTNATGGTLDHADDLPLGRWVRLGDLQNWRNPLSKIFLADEPAGSKVRGVIFHAVRGLINDDSGSKLCDFDFSTSGPAEIATSNRRSYTSDGKPLPRQTLPQSAAASIGGSATCAFTGQ